MITVTDKKDRFKKVLLIAIAAIFIAALAAGIIIQNRAGEAEQTAETTAEETTVEPTAALTEITEVLDNEYTTTRYQTTKRETTTAQAYNSHGGAHGSGPARGFIADAVDGDSPKNNNANTTTKYTRTTTTKKTTTDPYHAKDFYDAEDFYDEYYDDFFDYYDAEDYWRDHQ